MMGKIWFLLIALVLLWAVGFCRAGDSLRERLAKLDTSSQNQPGAPDSTFRQRFDSNSFVKRFGLLEVQVKTLEEAGRSRDSRISSLEGAQKVLQELAEARDLRMSELERRLAAIETRVKARPSDEPPQTRVMESQPDASDEVSDSTPSSPARDTPAAPTVTPSNFAADVSLPAESTTGPDAEAQPVSEPVVAAAAAIADPDDIVWQRETLTNGFGGLNDSLADRGIEVALGLTNVYQQNTHGGISTHRRQGRHTGSYDLEISSDVQKLLGAEGGTLYVHAEGSWSRTDIDGTSVGSVFGVNADAGGRRSMDVTEVWYEQAFFDETLLVRLGKLDITGGFECRGCPVSFDGSLFANDETGQFLNGALVNNPTIPFPDFGLGAILHWNPVESWYASVGAIDAQADGRETGFRTTFHGEDYFFYVFETGITPQFSSANGPLQGAYRVGAWNDPQPKANSDASKTYRDDVGFYLSCDQMLCKENKQAEDSQGLGTFFRYGMANGRKNDISDFWSAGFQYQGLLDGRDDDVLGVGFAQGVFSNEASTTYPADSEGVFEAYYNVQVSPWWNVSPGIQYVANPGGAGAVSDVMVVGVRSQMAF